MKYDIYKFVDAMLDAEKSCEICEEIDSLVSNLNKYDMDIILSNNDYDSILQSVIPGLSDITDWCKNKLVPTFSGWKQILEREIKIDIDQIPSFINQQGWNDSEFIESSIIDDNGDRLVKFVFDNGIIVKTKYNDSGEIICVDYSFGEGNINIFANYNLELNQYGGNQMDIYSPDLLEDSKVLEILKKYYPGKSLEDYELYLKKIATSGCGFTAIINTIFKKYEGKEKEFEKKFGFSMYSVDSKGNINYNYEYLIIDSFCGLWSNGEYTFEQIIEGMNESSGKDASMTGEVYTVNTGVDQAKTKQVIEYLNNAYDMNIKVGSITFYDKEINFFEKLFDDKSKDSIKNSTNTLLKKALEEYDNVLIGAYGYDAYTMSGDLLKDSNNGHMMCITEITDDGKIIASSWGRKVELKVQDSRKIEIYAINYD